MLKLCAICGQNGVRVFNMNHLAICYPCHAITDEAHTIFMKNFYITPDGKVEKNYPKVPVEEEL